MRYFILINNFILAILASPASVIDTAGGNGFTIAQPGGIKDVVVTKDNTLNSTFNGIKPIMRNILALDFKALPLHLVNNYTGGPVNAYIQGLDPQGAVVFIGAHGNVIYPSSGGSTVPVAINQPIAISLPLQGQILTVNIPIFMTSGRVYFCEGHLQFFMVKTAFGEGIVQPSVVNMKDPSAGLNWGFVELTYNNEGIVYANISYVDFVGMILSMTLSVTDGSGTQTTGGLNTDAVSRLCNGLYTQKSIDGYPWSHMCIVDGLGNPIRVISPNTYQNIDSSGFQAYWQGYVNKVWIQYSSTPLTINTQTIAGRVNCTVSGDVMTCEGDNRGYSKPAATDIWGCNSGPFSKKDGDNGIHLAVIPRLCAAFVRSTLLLHGGNAEPSLGSTHYYTVDPTNHYSRIVHGLEINRKGYAFSYDDVSPDGNENVSGLVSSANADTLRIYIGAPP